MTAKTLPEPHQIAAIFTELQRLGIPMKGWYAEPDGPPNTGDPVYGIEVAPEALTDSDATWMVFQWDSTHGWTVDDGCNPQTHKSGVTVLDIPGDPFDAPAVAAHLRKVVVGEIDEFRTAVA